MTAMAERSSGRPNRPFPLAGTAVVVLGLVALVGLLYGPSLSAGILWDDPLWYQRARAQTLAEILAGSPDYQFYRPLALGYARLWWLDERLWSWGLHLAELAYHAGVTVLTVALAWQWTGQRLAALLAGLLTAVFPFSQQAVTWTTTQQPQMTLLLLLATCAYVRFQRARRRRWLAASLTAYAAAVLFQEGAVPLALLFVLLELPGLREEGGGRDSLPSSWRRLGWAGGHLAIAITFVLLYLRAERMAGIAGWHFETIVGAYVLQAVALPLARVVALAGALGPPDGVWWASGTWPLAGLALLFLATWLGVAVALVQAGWQRVAVLASAWVLLTLLPLWACLAWDYIETGPRLVYTAVPGIAILWACAASLGLRARRRATRWLTGLLTIALLLACVADVRLQNRMLLTGTAHLQAAVAAQAGPEERLLFINFPDRYRLRSPPFPLGFWGVTLAPVVQDLSDYAVVLTGRGDSTQSWSMPAANATERAAWPYEVDMRGVAIQWPELVRLARQVDRVLVSRYEPDGGLRLLPVGALLPPQSGKRAELGGARLVASRLTSAGGRAQLSLWWQQQAARTTQAGDAVFVHLRDDLGRTVAQWDADTWAGLLPPKAWPGDRTVMDLRDLDLTRVPPGRYTLFVGLYNHKTGQRYAAQDAAGRSWPEDSVPVGQLIVALEEGR